MQNRFRKRLGLVIAAAMLAAPTAVVAKAPFDDGATDGHQHGGEGGHLPAISLNVSVVGRVDVAGVGEGQIADVAVWGDYAYLASFAQPACAGPESVDDGGVFIVDISDPENPFEVGFIDSHQDTYVGEGVQVLRIDTAQFSGDLLVQNNEGCGKNYKGGFSLYDVSNPLKPTKLVENFGDKTIFDARVLPDANTIHSAFAWQDDETGRAYVVTADNHEFADVDIYDITNPKKPFMVAEYDLSELEPSILQGEDGTLGSFAAWFHHDVVVKEINGTQTMLVSYWDAGYVVLDVDDPANATYIADSDFTDPDPQLLEQTGEAREPEGNAHQAEFTLDNAYILAADEDFTSSGTEIAFGGETTNGSPGSDTPPLDIGESLVGTPVYVGRACAGDDPVPAPPAADGYVAVATRGFCAFTEKVTNIEAAGGYDAAIIINREGDCGAFGMTVEGTIPAFSIDRESGYALFGVDGFDLGACLAGGDTLEGSLLPGLVPGAIGEVVTVTAFFDGWGYVHLYGNGSGKLVELDTYAIDEAMDPTFAHGYGDLSVHEVATSLQRDNLLYFAYYSAGFRVAEIEKGKIVEKGHYIDEGGSNLWGVEAFTKDGVEYVATSDRDHGLWIFKYNG